MFNDFNYTPRPVFQSYSAYTPKLAELNREFITSADAPEFLLLKLQTIDERPLLADDSRLMVLFPHLYEFKLFEKDFHVFQRREASPDPQDLLPRLVRTTEAAIGEEIVVSDLANEHLWLTVDLPLSRTGRLLKFLYKPAKVYLVVTDQDGNEERYRIARPIAMNGFQINPLVTDFETYLEAHGGESPRRIDSLRIEVAEDDRYLFADQAVLALSTLRPTNLKQEFARQLDRQNFASFSRLPDDFYAKTPISAQPIDGREAVIVHAPSLMSFPLTEPVSRVSGAHGYPPNAYSNGGETDGATFAITWIDGESSQVLYERNLDPLNEPQDRGLVDFDLTELDLPASGELHFSISINSHPGWDWTAWADIKIE